MAISSGTGIATGLDYSTLIPSLVAGERAPAANRITRLQSQTNTTLSALGTVTSAFDKLNTALEKLTAANALDTRSVSVAKGSGDKDIVSASVANGATVGSYSVDVQQLASAHKLASAGVDAEAALGGGTFTLAVGDKSVEVTLDAAASTPAELRDRINEAAGELGVTASLVTADDGVHLVLTSGKAGAENAISVTADTGNTALDAVFSGMTEKAPARDSIVVVDGLTRTSPSNSVADLIPGATLELKAVGTTEVNVTANTSGATSLMQSFVTAYNAAVTAIGSTTKYNAETQTAAALTGDAQMRGAASQLRTVLSEALGNAAAMGLDSKTLGVSTNLDGTIKFDSAAFTKAMADSPAAVQNMLTGDDGLATGLTKVLEGYVGDDGAFKLRTDGLKDQLKGYDKQLTDLDTRMEAVQARYEAQFTALETLVGTMSSTSSYLAQQLALLASSS
ncbi:flagellar filament capping protein FliD [Coralloluteibacterium stylophorae]|uniref:Flagellar hook-associated protein 2 n=1 Tax=Coralloluteibacterium stylophorae TaxID=1776034 RepID=A0A8J8AZ09_9GAMM|nr:flagellar filament capping protein FliD [Coralloluteibacterium stylophorae]MBS7457206.1 flagellar filament capping protein FliD [Coralloluteibacterium stylophorae]